MKPESIETVDLGNGTVHVSATFDAQSMANVFKMVNRMLAYTYEVDSKSDDDIPVLLAEKIGSEQLTAARDQAIPSLLAPFVVDGLEFEVILDPVIVQAPSALAGSAYTFEMDVERKPEFELSDYEPVTVSLPKARFEDDEVAGLMAAIADEYAEYAPAPEDARVQVGDRVTLDMETYSEFASVPSLCGKGIVAKAGEGWLSQEFDANLIGMSVGDKKRFTIQALTEASKDESDTEKLTVSIELKEIQRSEALNITDDWVTTHIEGASTVEDFERLVQEHLIEGTAQPYSQDMLLARVAEALASRLDMRISDALYQQTVNGLLAQMDQHAFSQGISFDDYLETLGLSMDTLGEYVMAQARSQIEQGFALDAYFRHFNMEIDDGDIDQAASVMVGSSRLDAIDSLRHQFELAGKMYVLREKARRLKANRAALDRAHIVYE